MKKHFCKRVFKILIGELFCSVFRDYFETMEKNTRNNNCLQEKYLIQWRESVQ